MDATETLAEVSALARDHYLRAARQHRDRTLACEVLFTIEHGVRPYGSSEAMRLYADFQDRLWADASRQLEAESPRCSDD